MYLNQELKIPPNLNVLYKIYILTKFSVCFSLLNASLIEKDVIQYVDNII